MAVIISMDMPKHCGECRLMVDGRHSTERYGSITGKESDETD